MLCEANSTDIKDGIASNSVFKLQGTVGHKIRAYDLEYDVSFS